MSVILYTIHGSRLYGTHHENSDYDYYTVSSNSLSGARQSIMGQEDQLTLSLDEFVRQCNSGVPQALEALYSPYKEVSPTYKPYLDAIRPSPIEVSMRYRRTIVNFSEKYGGRTKTHYDRQSERTHLKLRAHAVRLCLNLSDFLCYGMFNPVMTEEQLKLISQISQSPDSVDLVRELLERSLYAH